MAKSLLILNVIMTTIPHRNDTFTSHNCNLSLHIMTKNNLHLGDHGPNQREHRYLSSLKNLPVSTRRHGESAVVNVGEILSQ